MPPALIAWDFDGVLNRNVVDGRFIWADRMDRDLGLDRVAFQRHVFGPGRAVEVMTGRIDLRQAVAEWLEDQGSDIGAEAFIDYWFTRDIFPDEEVLGWLRGSAARSVMATNNEAYRTRFIADDMGFADVVEHIFASGHLGCAKPEGAYFQAIEAWSGTAPSEILLVDDLGENVEAACARGWQAFHFTPHTRDLLPEVLGL